MVFTNLLTNSLAHTPEGGRIDLSFNFTGDKISWCQAPAIHVEIGFTNDRDVVITGGVNAGDLVILNPQLEGLKEGKKIVIQ